MDLSDERLPYNVNVQWWDQHGNLRITTARELQDEHARENIKIDIENMFNPTDQTSIRDAAGYLKEDLGKWWEAWRDRWCPGGSGWNYTGGGPHDV